MMKKIFPLLACLAFAAALLMAPPSSLAQSAQLTGAGSTFVFPIMSRWKEDFHQSHPGITINYQSIGSGGGVQQVKNQTVDFGASDYSLTDAQLAQMRPVVQVAESAGPVCITYNLGGLSRPLRLSASAIARVYLGEITYWNDPAITATNPGVQLPHQPVLVVHRSDGSGTTSIFTIYLSAVSPEWKGKVGSGPAVNWPVGLGGKGNEGVTGLVKQTEGAIGYVELAYADHNHMPVASVQNAAGNFIAPSPASTSAAIGASRAALARDVRSPIENAPGAQSYPIAGLTFLILPRDGSDRARRQALKLFVQYVLAAGQKIATSLDYAPLPASIQQLDERRLDLLTAGGKPLR